MRPLQAEGISAGTDGLGSDRHRWFAVLAGSHRGNHIWHLSALNFAELVLSQDGETLPPKFPGTLLFPGGACTEPWVARLQGAYAGSKQPLLPATGGGGTAQWLEKGHWLTAPWGGVRTRQTRT